MTPTLLHQLSSNELATWLSEISTFGGGSRRSVDEEAGAVPEFTCRAFSERTFK